MRPGHVLSSSSSHSARSRPRSPNPGPVQHDSLDSTSPTPSTSSAQCNHHQAASIGIDEGDGDALMSHVIEQEENEEDLEEGGDGEEEEEDQSHIDDSITTSAEHSHPSEADGEEEEDEDDGDDDDESLCYGQHYHHQHQALNHFLSQHEHEHAHTQNHSHDTDDDDNNNGDDDDDDDDHETPTQPPQPPFFSDLDGYISDDLDMSDADMSLATYLDIATILTSNNMDLDDAGSELDYDFHGPNPHPTPPDYDPPSMAPVPPPAESPSVPPTTTPLPSAPIPHLTHMTFVASTYYIPPTSFTQSHMLSVSHITSQLQQLVSEADHSTGGWFPGGAHPIPLSGGGPGTLGPGNYNLVDFLHNWARQSRGLSGLPRERGRYPWPSRIHELSSRPLTHIQYADLNGDQCDLQGLDWDDLGVTRKEARERRLLTYNNYVNQPGTDRWAVSSHPHKLTLSHLSHTTLAKPTRCINTSQRELLQVSTYGHSA